MVPVVAVFGLILLSAGPERPISHIRLPDPPRTYMLAASASCESGLTVRIVRHGFSLPSGSGPVIFANERALEGETVDLIADALADDRATYRFRILCDREQARASVSISMMRIAEDNSLQYYAGEFVVNTSEVEDFTPLREASAQSFWLW